MSKQDCCGARCSSTSSAGAMAPADCFKDVAALNVLFGKPAGDPRCPDWDSATTQLSLVQEEVGELIEAFDLELMVSGGQVTDDVRNAIADLVVVVGGMAHILGLDIQADLKAVHDSNMSKLCLTLPDVEATAAYCHQVVGLEVYIGGDEGAWWVKSARDQVSNNGQHYPAHKLLKSVGRFHEPRFAPLPEVPGHE